MLRILALACFAVSLSALACGGGGTKCVPGTARVCTGFGSCAGGRTCKADGSYGPCTCGGQTFQDTFDENPIRQIDLLFMVDNSSSMEPSQANLVRSLPAFMNVLKAAPGGLPDLHIAVVTSDMGAGDGSIVGCMGNGNGGVFQFAPRTPLAGGLPPCTATTLQGGATYISDTGGATPTTNFTAPDITTVLQCIAPVGASGCGFEHQLSSVVRALGADNFNANGQPSPPQENAGFLRPDAYLAIVFITNEDDCSAPVNSVLYDTNVNTNLVSQVGPPGNFRCNEFGHLCSLNGAAAAAPSRLSPNPGDLTTTVSYDNCVSSEGQGLLTPIQTFANQIKRLKSNPAAQIVVASIQGPSTPYTVHWTAPPTPDRGPWPSILHSCDGGSASGFADPGVRMQQLVTQFGVNGAVFSICETDYTAPLSTIAAKVSGLVGPKCITASISTRQSSTTPDCTVTDINGATRTPVPSCDDSGGTAPCWSLDQPMPASSCPAGAHVLHVLRTATPPSNARVALDCALCASGVPPDPTRTCL